MKLITFIFSALIATTTLSGQNMIEPEEGYTPQIGVLVSMLNDMKDRVEQTVKNMDVSEVDYLMDDSSNSVGALIMHLAATEAFYQAFTFEGRQLNNEENAKWGIAQNLGKAARKEYRNKSVKEYLKEFDKVRAKTLELFKTKDDAWLAEVQNGMNNHWAWYHVMEHQSSHLGQILLMRKRFEN